MPGTTWREPFTWFVREIVGFFRLVTNPRGRSCPVCGTRLEEGVRVCPTCGYWPGAFRSPLPHPLAGSPETMPPASPPPPETMPPASPPPTG
jgi:zinc-ribbon domain